MTDDEKIAEVESQARLMIAGKLDGFTCPYCGLPIPIYCDPCCPLFYAALWAVLDRIDTEKRVSLMIEVGQKHSEMVH